MINNALNPQKKKLRNTKNRRNTAVMYSRGKQKPVEGESSCYYISANGSHNSCKILNSIARSMPTEGGKSDEKFLANGYQVICITRNISTNGKQRLRSQSSN